jgi:acyl-CoA dehydrogenase
MSENRVFFRETVERILADTLDQNLIEASERRALPTALYAALAENGVTHMLVPEDKGGIGADIGDAVAILRAMGAAAAPGPIVETLLGNKLLAEAGLDPVAGMIALAFAEGDDATTLHDVLWGGVADHVLIVTPGGLRLTAASDWTVAPALDSADEPRDTLTDGPAGSVTPLDTSAARRAAAILRAGQILGAVEWVLTRSIEYAGERKQFGREISKFQVVQQMLAELADHMLASAVLTEAAAESLSDTMIAAARSRLGDAADAAIATGHQVHGALGFSKEYALNHRTRRLMAWRDDYGSVLEWRRELAGAFVTCSREQFWPAVSDAGLRAAG